MSIGRLLKACQMGRADAQAGRRRHWRVFADTDQRRVYFDAWRRERAAMDAVGKLPQLRMEELLPDAPTPVRNPLQRELAPV